MKAGKVFRFALSLPKTIYVNFRTLPAKQAIRLPILVDVATKVRGIQKSSVVIEAPCTTFMIKYGFQPGTEGVPQQNKSNMLMIGKGGVVKFYGKAQLARGIHIRIDSGEIDFGKNFTCNKSCFFSSNQKISFGENVLIGWNSTVRDMDGHDIWMKDQPQMILNPETPVTIGDNVWIAACADIFKGANIPNGCIVGYRAGVFGRFEEEKAVVAGFPARIIRHGICWK